MKDESPNMPAVAEIAHPDLARQIMGLCEADHLTAEGQEGAEQEAGLAAIVDHSDDAIISKDLNGVIQSWNKGAERIFGYTAEEAIGKSIAMLIPPERIEEVPNILSRIGRGDHIDHYETVRRRKDGTLIDISLTVSPLKDTAGRIVGASKIARDITERKRAEAALRQSEKRLRQLADSMPQIVWMAGADGSVEYFNRRWYEYTDLPEGEFGQETWMSILHPEDAPRCVKTYFDCVREGSAYQIEYRFKDRKHGGYRWFLGRAVPIRDDQGRIIRWFGTCTDIDDQKRTTERLEQAVAERTASLREALAQMEQFSYSVSHDLRAPLRAMQGFSGALLSDFGADMPDEAKRWLQLIASNAKQLDKMVMDVLAFTRAARADFKAERVAVDRLVRQIVEQNHGLKPPCAQIRIGDLPEVLGHEPSLNQVFTNLLNNAIKFVAPSVTPQVHIWGERKDGQVRIWVADNGIGIDPRFQHRLFGLFERMHPALGYDGTGVGLAIVRKAMERMGGRVGVESDGVNGSRFWIEMRTAE